MKHLIFYIGLIIMVTNVSAQDNEKTVRTIKGKVINEATNEPVSYTNIGLEGTYIGTASNIEGNFELKITEENSRKNIFFSAVGYQGSSFPVLGLFDKEFNIIKLQPQSYDIGRIDVAARSKVFIRILRMATENTSYNFLGGPFNLVCSYENSKTTSSGTVQSIQKGSVLIFDKNGYSNPSKYDAFESVKYSFRKEGKDSADYQFSTGINNLDELLELDWVRAGSSLLNEALLDEFDFTLAEEPVIDGKNFWIINFRQNQPTLGGTGDFYATSFEGKITIAKDDYSVKKIEGKVRSAKNSLQGRSIAVSTQSIKVRENVEYNFTVTYSGLKVDEILLNKTYVSEGLDFSEQSRLKVNQVQTTNLTAFETRSYFSGE
jgi:hypothetical protein